MARLSWRGAWLHINELSPISVITRRAEE